MNDEREGEREGERGGRERERERENDQMVKQRQPTAFQIKSSAMQLNVKMFGKNVNGFFVTPPKVKATVRNINKTEMLFSLISLCDVLPRNCTE